MEEHALPFHKNDIVPKNKVDRGLFMFMTVIIPSVVIWEMTVLYHYHSTLDIIVYFHVIAGVFLLVNIIGNLYFLKRVDASGKKRSLPAILPVGWRYCHFCNLNAPPRAYHCPTCDECILKRDQHCMFAGCCVGFHNHRYYLLSIMYLWIGALYALLYQWEYCFETIGGFHLSSFVKLLAPHLAFPLGFLSLYGFVFSLIHIILLLAVALTSYLIHQQLTCIYYGQTLHEKKENKTQYDLGWKNNFLQVFGERWYIVLISPFTFSPLTGDGVNFTYDVLNNVKDI